ncbi:MAG: transposase [Thermodesulfobacteriota bacterium]|nr:transposase [Thermodesulfobacteriota bacterium]
MPRQPRLDTPGALHHVMGRGIERTNIFRIDRDRDDFLNRLANQCIKRNLIVYAWCLLSNHFHLLVRTGRQPISRSMKELLTGYVVNFNLRHKRTGHLFQNRYKSIICEDDPYLLELTRYIHLNPLRAGKVGDLEELNNYRWAGHSVIMGRVERKWQDIDTVLGYFGRRQEAVEKYEQFVREGLSQGRRPELVGGGLIRSLGGWSQVLSLKRKGIKVASDERILGGDKFVQKLMSEAEEREKETLRLGRKVPDLVTLAKRIVRGEGVEETELRSGIRKRGVVRARKLFCQLAIGRMGYPGAEVARFLGVTTSSVNRLVVSEEVSDLKKYLKLF